jgi:hypothetical protein
MVQLPPLIAVGSANVILLVDASQEYRTKPMVRRHKKDRLAAMGGRIM